MVITLAEDVLVYIIYGHDKKKAERYDKLGQNPTSSRSVTKNAKPVLCFIQSYL